MADNPTPSLGPGGLSLFGVVAIALWECLKFLSKVIKFPIPKVLNGKTPKTELAEFRVRVETLEEKLDQLRDDEIRKVADAMAILRQVEFPAHARNIASLTLAMREVQDQQTAILERHRDVVGALSEIGRSVKALQRARDGTI